MIKKSMNDNIDIGRLMALKNEMDELQAQRKHKKSEADQLEEKLVTALLTYNKRYIDTSNNGTGPFLTLTKDSQIGTWNDAKYLNFFEALCHRIYDQNERISPEQMKQEAIHFLKQYEKRVLKIEPHPRCPKTGTCEDLIQWKNGVE
jgi:hypothetical protein